MMDVLSNVDPETGKRIMAEPSYKRLVARIAAARGQCEHREQVAENRKGAPIVCSQCGETVGRA